MTKLIQEVVLKKDAKKNKQGSYDEFLYLKNIPCVYAQLDKPVNKMNSEEKEYQVTVFVTEEIKDKLEEIGLNKGFAEVGKTKKKKGVNKGKLKYPLDDTYSQFKGMFGFSLAQPEFSKQGNKLSMKVVGMNNKPFTETVEDNEGEMTTRGINIGNGSILTIKCFGYRSEDGELNVRLNTVVVKEHVPYTGGGADEIDDELGLDMNAKTETQEFDDEFGDNEAEEKAPFESDDY